MLFDFQKGTTVQNDALTLDEGKLSIDTETPNIRVHDGTTAGGHPTPTLETPT